MSDGYYRQPSIHGDTVVFVCEDDLWRVPATGGRADRLTSGVAESRRPHFSPDGTHVAFTGREEGPSEVYVMDAMGGEPARLTFQGALCSVAAWTPDGKDIVYASDAGLPFRREFTLYTVPATGESGGLPILLPYGPATSIAYGDGGLIVLGRNTGEAGDPARWKRYRGGMVGDVWVDRDGSGMFSRLITLDGNVAAPCIVGDRIFFISDHEGVGNIYSCLPTGDDLRRHTTHDTYYARGLASDGTRLVYYAGADLYLLDPDAKSSERIGVDFASGRTQRSRRFVPAAEYLDSYALSPDGSHVAITTRGKAYTMGDWEGPVTHYGAADGVRYRLFRYRDHKRLVAISDADGIEAIELFDHTTHGESRRLEGLGIGRPVELEVSPDGARVALTNHRGELLDVDLESGTMRVLEQSPFGDISGIAWSADGRLVAYSYPESISTASIHLCEIGSGTTHRITAPILRDVAPAFDPDGKYVYFLGYRSFNPVADNLHFEHGFPRGVRPYAVTLRADLPSPFVAMPKPPVSEEVETKRAADDEEEEPSSAPVTIDIEGIEGRVVPFPVSDARYDRVLGIKGKVLLLYAPLSGELDDTDDSELDDGTVELYDFDEQKSDVLIDNVGDIRLSADTRTLIYSTGDRLRVLPAGHKPPGDGSEGSDDKPTRETGWINLDRIRVSVNPPAEWRQMFGETWRLQRDQFWLATMGGVDWESVYRAYLPLVDRITTRSELSDLLWEMQGELGTSHAYEYGGEYRLSPVYSMGFLLADWIYDAPTTTYRIGRIAEGDPSSEETMSPLRMPGVNVQPGDRVLAVNGQAVGRGGPDALLVNMAGQEVALTIAADDGSDVRDIVVKTQRAERPVRYRSWVDAQRRRVHAETDGRVGYIHIPDMGEKGYAEFHRGFLIEFDREALIIDVRWNGGGSVSGLLLEKLGRKRLGYDLPRYGVPLPYPQESPRGPMVMLTNEAAGSDGDIVSHSFKMMGLGPLIGTRTWGGVIGIEPTHRLVDNTTTTQPEFSFFFDDVGWGIENRGAEPDIEVQITPQDYMAGQDPQLARGIAEALRILAERPAHAPQPPPYSGLIPRHSPSRQG